MQILFNKVLQLLTNHTGAWFPESAPAAAIVSHSFNPFACSEHEKNENDFMRVLEATLNREIETRDKLKAEIQSCKDVVRNFLASIEI
jgi:hypothetical protein